MPSFGQNIRFLAIDVGQIPGVIGIQNLYGQELGGIETVNFLGLTYLGYDEGTVTNMNFGPITGLAMAVGTGNNTCGPHTTAIFLHSLNNDRPIGDITATANVGCTGGARGQAQTAFMIDTSDRQIHDVHCETFSNCFTLGANNKISNIAIDRVTGQPGVNNIVMVSNANLNHNFSINGISRGNANFALADFLNGNFISDPKVVNYAESCLGDNSSCSIMTAHPDVMSYSFGGVHPLGNLRQVATGDFSTSSTTLTVLSPLSWVLTQMTSKTTYSFSCDIMYSQSPVATVTFGIQTAANAPINWAASGVVYTGMNAFTEGTQTGVSSTTSTNVVSLVAPSGTGIFPAHFAGTVELPAVTVNVPTPPAATTTTLRLMGLTSSALSPLTIKRGSYCILY